MIIASALPLICSLFHEQLLSISLTMPRNTNIDCDLIANGNLTVTHCSCVTVIQQWIQSSVVTSENWQLQNIYFYMVLILQVSHILKVQKPLGSVHRPTTDIKHWHELCDHLSHIVFTVRLNLYVPFFRTHTLLIIRPSLWLCSHATCTGRGPPFPRPAQGQCRTQSALAVGASASPGMWLCRQMLEPSC